MFALNGFFIAGAVICAAALLVALVATVIRKHPDDWALIGAAATEAFLVVYGIAAAIRQASGNAVQGDPWEFWGYLITALVMPPVAFFWAISEKSRWSNAVLGASALVTFIMLFRMEQIWH
ncbi:hypothetical protein OF385_04855 [Glutamicibacter sp. JL.03c]|uniref:hypothetical protein n=1 Tax=Glutamicibacter sp. JL.03c TaxID=2984842 RepID=UPI0021F7B5DD|nr:hypothetical protein [Glutamicibacter sp. JL.03c]UYQ78483.1 hypothetical protein OF385_04855 [Glutamicibacter sp. JL.03c]